MSIKSKADRFAAGNLAAKLVFPPSSLYIPRANLPIIPADCFKQIGASQELAILPIKPETQKLKAIPFKPDPLTFQVSSAAALPVTVQAESAPPTARCHFIAPNREPDGAG
jgi:hypothetical protein